MILNVDSKTASERVLGSHGIILKTSVDAHRRITIMGASSFPPVLVLVGKTREWIRKDSQAIDLLVFPKP